MHCMAYIAHRKHPLERHTHTHTQAWRVKGAHACCRDDAPAAPARTHVHAAHSDRTRVRRKRKKGERGDKEEEKKKREGGKECSWCACIGLAPSQGVRPHPMPCPAPLPPPKAAKAGGLSGRRKEVR